LRFILGLELVGLDFARHCYGGICINPKNLIRNWSLVEARSGGGEQKGSFPATAEMNIYLEEESVEIGDHWLEESKFVSQTLFLPTVTLFPRLDIIELSDI
jgi:hypothetical protein